MFLVEPLSSSSSSLRLQSSTSPTTTPASASAGRGPVSRASPGGGQLERALANLRQCLVRGASVGGADEQAGLLLTIRPATRTWKNSSRFDEKYAQLRDRSSSGSAESAARRGPVRCSRARTAPG